MSLKKLKRTKKTHIEKKYVAFCDILGFSNSVLTKFDYTKSVYNNIINIISEKSIFNKVNVSMYSDSIIVIGAELPHVITAVRNLCWFCLGEGLIIRGGIAYGKHWEQKDKNNYYVVSEALVKAVKIEKNISVPIIAISDEIKLDYTYWLNRVIVYPDQSVDPIFLTPLFYYDGINFVNPLSPYWYKTAIIKTENILSEFPNHAHKYQWLLSLYQEVEKKSLLIPQEMYDYITKEIVPKFGK